VRSTLVRATNRSASTERELVRSMARLGRGPAGEKDVAVGSAVSFGGRKEPVSLVLPVVLSQLAAVAKRRSIETR